MDKLKNFLENLKQVDLTKINWGQLLDWDYLTDPTPTKHFIYEQWLYVCVLANFAIAFLGFRYISGKFFETKPKFRLLRRASFLWFSNSIFLLLYNLVRSEGINLLSMRLFLVLIILGFITILIYSAVYWVVVLPKRIEKFNEARMRDQYKRKKKN